MPTNSLVDGQVAVLALTVVLVAVAGRACWDSRNRLPDLAVVLGVIALALLLRAAASWGPADLAEPRRWDVLYAQQPADRPLFFGVATLVDVGTALGLSGAWIYRWLGPLSGALAAGAT